MPAIVRHGWKPLLLHLVALALLFAEALAQPQRQPINTMKQLWPAIMACWKPPAGAEGSEITLRFGVTSRGELRGPPMVTYSKLRGSPALREDFAKSAFKAVADCTPLNLTKEFGAQVSDSVFAVRFVHRVSPRRAI